MAPNSNRDNGSMVAFPRLSRMDMVRAMQSCDQAFDGRFVVCVKTTGIYCLPSCKVPRKPLEKNCEFVQSFEEARALGFRPCKLCKPDEFERGEDRDLERLESLVRRVRQDPGSFGSVADMAREVGWSASKFHDECRFHYQVAPGELLTSSRIERSKALLLGGASVGEAAHASGYDSLSAFSERFKLANGLNPSAYRELAHASEFEIELPAEFSCERWLSRIARDADDVIERLEGNRLTVGIRDGERASDLVMEVGVTVRCVVESSAASADGLGAKCHSTAIRLLGLAQDPREFEKHAASIGHDRIYGNRKGARIPQTVSVFDGLIWAVLGQQVNLSFARTLRRTLFELAGPRTPSGLFATPSPEVVAGLDPKELCERQFSARKAEYLIAVGRNFDSLNAAFEGSSVTTVKSKLLGQRGFGPWASNYVMMRALGLPDCLPLGDTGLAAGLERYFGLECRPSSEAQEKLAAPFQPFRSFLTYHLWQGFQSKP